MPYPQYYQQMQSMQSMSQPQMQQQLSIPQISNGFISVRSEIEARNYPVGLGNSVTFKDENAPYVYTKTMGFSQLETPRFEKYKLVKEEPVLTQEDTSNSKIDISSMEEDIETLKREIEALKREVFKSTPQRKKKEVTDNDTE